MGGSTPVTYFFCTLYGLRLQCDVNVPGLAACAEHAKPDAVVWLRNPPGHIAALREAEEEPYYVSPYIGDYGTPILFLHKLLGGAWFKFHYDDATEFFVDRSGTEVFAQWPPSSTLDDTAAYFLGLVMGFVLHLRGQVCLHASAVAIEGRAIALMGPAGAGKSTTAAAFARQGFAVLSDDIVTLSAGAGGEAFLVHPGYPRLCLCPRTAATLYGSADALPLFAANWDKRYLDLQHNGYRFAQHALPLAAVYRLAERSETEATPRIEAMSARAALLDLVGNSYANYLLDDQQRAAEFAVLGRVAARVPMLRVSAPEDPERLEQLCNALSRDAVGRGAVRPGEA
jgi:hypothetical protein